MRIAIIASTLAVLGGLMAQVKALASTGEDVPVATQSLVVKNPADLQWKLKEALPQTPSPAHAAVAWGDPATGAYAFFGKFPAGFTVPMHWHTNAVLVVMTTAWSSPPRGPHRTRSRKAASSRCRPR